MSSAPSAAKRPPTQLPEPLRGFDLRITSHKLGENCSDKSKGHRLKVYDYQYDQPGDAALLERDIKGRKLRKWLELEPDGVPVAEYTYSEGFEHATRNQGPTIMLEYHVDNEYMDTHLDNFNYSTLASEIKNEFGGRSHGRYADSKPVVFNRRESCIQSLLFVPIDIVSDNRENEGYGERICMGFDGEMEVRIWRCTSTTRAGAEKQPVNVPVLESINRRQMFEDDIEEPTITHSLE